MHSRIPFELFLDIVGLSPHIPQKLAGIRMEPPISDPIPNGAPPAPTKQPVPLLDPPGLSFLFRGLRVKPKMGFSLLPENVVWGRFVLQNGTAPASSSTLTTTALSVAGL